MVCPAMAQESHAHVLADRRDRAEFSSERRLDEHWFTPEQPHLILKMRRLVAFVLLLGTIACHSGRTSRPQPGPVDQYLILTAELESSKQTNVYDAVRHLRPFWLTRNVRGRTGENRIAVYVDEQFIGTVSTLRRISVVAVARMRYMSATEAQTRFGQANRGRAAILVESGNP
jgi:hypothetical protein